uniref:BTB domain-containing protein n=1 Tax=Varanus komodoensis TaxID=61221 RepID=A0A8D2JIB7_VARKO
MDFPQHSKQVLEQLNQQRQLGLLCDCTFVVDGIDFKAHKAVLAACSEYFRMLFVDQKDVVHLDISNAAGLEQVLDFMYTAKLNLSPENVEDVLAVAGFLQIQEVVGACRTLQALAAPAETSAMCSAAAPAADGMVLPSCPGLVRPEWALCVWHNRRVGLSGMGPAEPRGLHVMPRVALCLFQGRRRQLAGVKKRGPPLGSRSRSRNRNRTRRRRAPPLDCKRQ